MIYTEYIQEQYKRNNRKGSIETYPFIVHAGKVIEYDLTDLKKDTPLDRKRIN